MYFEYTLLGMSVKHQSDGVPLIQHDHPLTKKADLSLMKRHDFYTSGDMPRIFSFMRICNRYLKVVLVLGFRHGDVDLWIWRSSYEVTSNLLTIRGTSSVRHDLMHYIIEERIRWWDAYCKHFNTQEKGAGIADDCFIYLS